MFYTLLFATFAISLLVSWIAVRLFPKPADRILKHMSQDRIYSCWLS